MALSVGAAVPEGFQLLPISALLPSPTNPRKHFDQALLDELAQSIREHGVLQPLVARPHKKKEDHFEIICGERRFRGAQLAGSHALPVMVRDLSDADVLEIQLIENVQRNELDPLEEAKGYKALIDSNPAKYSAAFIAERIGRSERFVWDRMKLLDLVPEAQELLTANIILVGHAELLAKLKPEDQKRALKLPTHGYGGGNGALFESADALLPIGDGEELDELTKKYRKFKPVSVKEFEAWIAHDVRLDPVQAAAAAPLDFGDLPAKIQEAEARPGRGHKWVAITHDHRVSDAARDDDQRTIGRDHWKRADTKTCDKRVLGVIGAGEGKGQAFDVCVNKDCTVHWAAEARHRKKVAAARASGDTKKAKKAEDSWAEKQRQAREKEKQAAAAYAKLYPLVVDAIKAKIPSTFDRTVFEFLYRGKAPQVPPAKFIETLVMQEVEQQKPSDYGSDWKTRELTAIAKHFGVDITKLKAQIDRETKAAKPPAAPKAAKKGRAKKS